MNRSVHNIPTLVALFIDHFNYELCKYRVNMHAAFRVCASVYVYVPSMENEIKCSLLHSHLNGQLYNVNHCLIAKCLFVAEIWQISTKRTRRALRNICKLLHMSNVKRNIIWMVCDYVCRITAKYTCRMRCIVRNVCFSTSHSVHGLPFSRWSLELGWAHFRFKHTDILLYSIAMNTSLSPAEVYDISHLVRVQVAFAVSHHHSSQAAMHCSVWFHSSIIKSYNDFAGGHFAGLAFDRPLLSVPRCRDNQLRTYDLCGFHFASTQRARARIRLPCVCKYFLHI